MSPRYVCRRPNLEALDGADEAVILGADDAPLRIPTAIFAALYEPAPERRKAVNRAKAVKKRRHTDKPGRRPTTTGVTATGKRIGRPPKVRFCLECNKDTTGDPCGSCGTPRNRTSPAAAEA